jgi:chemotaxis protein methyltransferase CheR
MIAPHDYAFLSDLLHKQSGLHLGAGKDYLLESRLPPVAATFGVTNLDGLISYLRRSPAPAAVKAVCDAMTTGETLFFRDNTPFNVFRDQLLPESVERAKRAGRAARVWSAACSTGQEAYSLSMVIDQCEAKLAGTRVEIVATDYSSPTVARARAGVFNQFEVQRGLPVQLLLKYFTKTEKGYEISPAIKRRVAFHEHNLLGACGAFGYFDIIFIRNVLIYFDAATKKGVLERLARQLTPGGCIVLGGTENTLGVTDTIVREAGCAAPVYRAAAGMAARSAA